MYTALDVAKYIVTKCTNDHHSISNLQLQKIMYYIQKDYLTKGKHSNPSKDCLFYDEFEAWHFGPVIPEVYYFFCGAGAMPIPYTTDTVKLLKKDTEIIDSIVEEKRELHPWLMVKETHKAGGAWATTYDNGKGFRKIIPKTSIKERG